MKDKRLSRECGIRFDDEECVDMENISERLRRIRLTEEYLKNRTRRELVNIQEEGSAKMDNNNNKWNKIANEKPDLASYTFSDKSRLAVVESDFEKKVKDHTEKYTSFRVKYYDPKGIDLKYSYMNFYRNALSLAYRLWKQGMTIEAVKGPNSRDWVMELLYKVYKVEGLNEPLIAKLSSDNFSGEFLSKLLIGAHYGNYAEDHYLKYGNTKYKFGRKFNLVKYYLVLIGDTEDKVLDREVFPEGRLTAGQAAVIWNKDETTVGQKAEYIKILMAQIMKRYEPGYKDIETAWE